MADNIQATPRNYIGGLLTDAYKWMQSPERTQQLQGFAGLLGTTGIPQTIERMAYGEPLTNIGRANVPLLKPETADALMTVAGIAPELKAAAKMLPKNIPVGMGIKPVVYPQEEALKLAQQRAALPVEKGGLGLPANNTAADRAKAMGFDTQTFHGSPNPYIEEFDPNMAGVNTGNTFDNNIFSTSSPESAAGYALNWKYYRNTIKNSPEFKSITREENSLINKIGDLREAGNDKGVANIKARLDELTQQKTNIYNDFMAGRLGSEGSSVYPLMVRSEDFLPYEAAGANWMRANRPAIDAAEQAGYSGAVIKNVKDNAGANLGTIADVHATTDPSLFRSRFAAFDPFRRNAAIAAAMGVAAPNLLAEEVPPQRGLLAP